MNEIVEKIQGDYRKVREQSNYSIIDVGDKLKNLAEKGLIWVLKDLRDISEFEMIVIDSYSNKYRTNQVYDNLDKHFHVHPVDELSTTTPFQTKNNIPLTKLKKKKQNTLIVRDVKQFKGYLLAKNLEENILEMCKSYPSYERDYIVNQIERSAESIKRRIAMGEQIYIGEKFYQYSIAIGSAKETSSWLQISLGQNYISLEQYKELDNLVTQVVAILTGTLANIKKKDGEGMDLPSPFTPNIKDFDAYIQALLLVEMVYELTRGKEFWGERYLQSEIRKNATSCAANIAEAHQLYVPMTYRFFNKALEMLNGLDSLLDTSISKQITTEESIADIKRLRESIRNILSKRLANMSEEKAS